MVTTSNAAPAAASNFVHLEYRPAGMLVPRKLMTVDVEYAPDADGKQQVGSVRVEQGSRTLVSGATDWNYMPAASMNPDAPNPAVDAAAGAFLRSYLPLVPSLRQHASGPSADAPRNGRFRMFVGGDGAAITGSLADESRPEVRTAVQLLTNLGNVAQNSVEPQRTPPAMLVC
jgi:hypothetical protein